MGIDATSACGALLVDKPSGPTSHDIVAFVRRTLKTSRVGHTGTLDPLATGLLIVLLGNATRLAQFLSSDEKEYIADVRLGVSTPTYDAASLSSTGDARREAREATEVTEQEIESVLDRFRGSFMQTPPPYSAKKIASVPAYEKARKNQEVVLKAVQVTVRELQVLAAFPTPSLQPPISNLQPPTSAPRASRLAPPASLLRLRVVTSAGFYVRSLAHDIGAALGCGAHLEALRRTRVGRYQVEHALTLDQVEGRAAGVIVPPATLLTDMPAVTLTPAGVIRAGHGNSIGIRDVAGSDPAVVIVGSDPGNAARVRLLNGAGGMVAVAERRPGGVLQPLVVLR